MSSPAPDTFGQAIQEILPAGLMVVEASAGINVVTLADGCLSVLSQAVSGEAQSWTYTVTTAQSGTDLSFAVSGIGSFDGVDHDVSGDNEIIISCFSLMLDQTGNGDGEITLNDNPVAVPATARVDAGSTIMLAATPAPGSHFDGWTGDIVDDQPAISATINMDSVASASFQRRVNEAHRSIAFDEACTPTVSIVLFIAAGVTSFVFVDEQLPAGSIPTLVSDDGFFNADKQLLRWTLGNGQLTSATKTLTYTITGNRGPISGTASFDGVKTDIAGVADVDHDCPVNLDIDGNGRLDALTDGILFLRYLAGTRDVQLIAGAVADDCGDDRCNSAGIEVFLGDAENTEVLDADGDGDLTVTRDGLLTIRYLFGLRGASLVSGIDLSVASGCRRCDAEAITAYLNSLRP